MIVVLGLLVEAPSALTFQDKSPAGSSPAAAAPTPPASATPESVEPAPMEVAETQLDPENPSPTAIADDGYNYDDPDQESSLCVNMGYHIINVYKWLSTFI